MTQERDTKQDVRAQDLLREKGFRATPGRLAIIGALKQADRPVSIRTLCERVGDTLNEATVYRAIDALTTAGLVQRVEMRHAHAHYELIRPEGHHHHLVCESCGLVEDIDVCMPSAFQATIARRSKRFVEINSHSLEFFGRCHACVIRT